MADQKITDLTLLTTPNGSEIYGVKSGLDYRIAIGGNNGLSYLDATGLVPTASLGTGVADNTKFLRGDGTWVAVAGGGGGTVTSVAVANATGITWTGSPITGSGTLTPALSANLQAWHALATSAKANASHTHTVSDISATGTPSGTTFLRGDGVWATPAGGGGGSGTVTSIGITPGTGVTSSGGPITSSGNIAVGLSANLQAWHALATSAKADTAHAHAAADITSGVLNAARLGTGTADSSKYLRGDGTWQTLSAGGTVTSVAWSGGTTGLSAGGSPITTSGTITLTGVLVVSNGGTGASSLTGYVKGNGTSAMTASTVVPAADLSGQVAVANGGTGGTTAATGRDGLGIYVQASDPGAVPDGSLWIW